jgi:hypothetical protein
MRPSQKYVKLFSRGLLSAACAVSCSLVMTSVLAAPSSAVGQFAAGDAFPLASQDNPQLSRLVFELGSCGPMLRSHWHDPTGMIIAAEELETGDAGFVRYRYWRPNVEESAVVTRSGPNTVSIELEQAGRKERREVEVSGDIAAGPMMTVLAQDSLTKLKEGDTVPVRYVVPDKFAAYTFNLARAARQSEASRIGISVTADSWAARGLTKNLTVYFNSNGEFQGLRGPSLPAIGTPQRKQALDLDVMVNRRYSRPCSPDPVSGPRELVD